ncbi:MAG: T9SS type A sorting domain-containing protein [Ignavibacteriales bacterium]|nr:T9SS type A sorting domain-containing protein [Ignavibacteriales bacterium]
MKKMLLLIALVVFIGSSAFSQGRVLDQKTKDALKELYKGVRDYAQGNIIPKMKEWKGTLDRSMAPADLRALNALRDRAAQLKMKGTRLALALKKAMQNNNASDIRMYRQKIKELATDRQALLTDLKPLGVKYKATLESIGKDAKPFGTEWKAGIKRVGLRWYEVHKEDLSVGFKAALAKAIERLKTLGALMGDDMKGKLAAAKFMLWDGQDLPEVNRMLSDDSTSPDNADSVTPDGYALETNYPNPFNPSTKISFTIPRADHVTLVVYDMLGKEVGTLVDSELGAGTHTVTFDGKNLASGTYIYRIRSGEFVQERTMQLIK